MNAQQLKNSILQEAIQGRLVPQDPTDEPASALLERIRAEKERLVKEGKLKKKDLVETPISEDEIPFEIPDSWEWVRFGTITINRDSERVPLSVDERSKLKKIYDYYGASGVIDKVDDYLFDKPLLLIGEDGANLINRSTPIAFIAKGKYWVNNHAHVLDYINEDLMQYMCWYINAISLVDYVTGTAQPKMNQEKMNSILVALPPLAEQKRIVAKIEELLPKVEEYGKAQDALNKLNAELPDRLKKSVLQEAIEGRLVPQDPNDEPASVLLAKIRQEKEQLVKEGKLKKKDLVVTPISEDEIPFDIPETWEWVRLGAITTVLGGKRIPAGRKLSQKNTGHVYIRVSDMKDDIVSMDNLQYVPEDIFPSISRYIINKEDVFITVAGTIGRIGKIPPELDGANLTENADRLVFTIIDQDWLIKCLQSVIVQSQISAVTTQVGQPKLAILRIQNLLVPLPPIAEQKRIVAKIEEVFAEIDKMKK